MCHGGPRFQAQNSSVSRRGTARHDYPIDVPGLCAWSFMRPSLSLCHTAIVTHSTSVTPVRSEYLASPFHKAFVLYDANVAPKHA